MDLGQTLLSSFTAATSVTTSNSADLSPFAQALYIGVSGDVKVDTVGGTTVTFKNVPVGILDMQCRRVYATGTSATEIIALYRK